MYGDREHNGMDDVCGCTVSHGRIDDGKIDASKIRLLPTSKSL